MQNIEYFHWPEILKSGSVGKQIRILEVGLLHLREAMEAFFLFCI